MNYYEKLRKDETYKYNLTDENKPFSSEIEKTLNFSKFRYYQKEALNIFDFFYNQDSSYYFKNELNENDIDYYGFEMATGSGKTYLIGATIVYLKSKGINNFLILTPNKTIYHKTIKNFDKNSNKCIFNSDLNFKYNLITGEDYTGRSSSFNTKIKTNIFVFNIQKFFDRVKGEKGESALKIKKAWEQGALKDENGNVVSLYDFLVNKKLSIITDEAHHYQKSVSKKVIINLKPVCVLEFTATAVEEKAIKESRKQKIIYKYSVDRYINDGFGKKIRALGHDTPEFDKTDKLKVSKADKEKIIIGLLIHFLKKKSLNGIKPILLIKARDQTEHANRIFKFIKEELPYLDSKIEEVYNGLIKDEKYNIIGLIKEKISLAEFKKELKKIKDKMITYHNKSSSEEEELFENVDSNDVEIIVQIKRAEEGWNVDNVYTILVLSYNKSKIKTNVKQLIGRGLRLSKGKRENFKDSFLEQTEILHILCEKEGNFSQFIDQIKAEMELTGESLESEAHQEDYNNKLILSDIKKYNNLKLPIYSYGSKIKFTANKILKELTYGKLKISSFIKQNTDTFKSKKILSFRESDQNIEESLTKEQDPLLLKEKENVQENNLILTETDFSKLINRLIGHKPILPGVVATKEVFVNTLMKINQEELKYITSYENPDESYFKRKLLSKLYKYLSDQIDNMFTNELKVENKYLKEIFFNEIIEKKTNLETKEVNFLSCTRSVPKKEIKKYHFSGYKKSLYEFNWFESSPEKDLALTLDDCNDVEFWIRNKRQYYLVYGTQNYYPDFIVKTKEGLFILEVKGEVYVEEAEDKINLLRELDNNKEIKVKGIFLLGKTIDNKIVNKLNSFREIVEYNELHEKLTKYDKKGFDRSYF